MLLDLWAATKQKARRPKPTHEQERGADHALIGEAPAKRRAKPGLLGLRVQCVEERPPRQDLITTSSPQVCLECHYAVQNGKATQAPAPKKGRRPKPSL